MTARSLAARRKALSDEANRTIGARHEAPSRKVMVGHHQVSDRSEEMLVTTLGSCVAACVRDPVAAVGGMNHFLLPEMPESHGGGISAAARYGSVAMERLINDILVRGGRRDRLEVKVFGGAKVIDTRLDIGAKNAAFVLDYIRKEGLKLLGQDLGGFCARRIHYFPVSGRALRRMLRPEALTQTVDIELQYMNRLSRKPIEGEIELFGDN